MNRYKTLILVTVIALMGGCAQLEPIDIKALTNITFNNWVAEHAPEASVFVNDKGEKEEGIYIKYLHKAPKSHDSLKIENLKWVRYTLDAYNLNNKTISISDSTSSHQAGKWYYGTHWVPHYRQFETLNPEFLSPGVLKVFATLNIGDKVRVYLSANEGFSTPPHLSNGNAGELDATQFIGTPSYVDIHLVDVNINPYSNVVDSINTFIRQKWNLHASDTIGEEGVFMKKTITNATGDIITKDSVFSMHVTRFFLDDFMYKTTSDSIAKIYNRYNTSDTETKYAKIRGTTQAMESDPNLPIIYSIAPLQMRKGETALFLVNPYYNPESYQGAPGKIPALLPYEPTYYKVEIDTITDGSTDLIDPIL